VQGGLDHTVVAAGREHGPALPDDRHVTPVPLDGSASQRVRNLMALALERGIALGPAPEGVQCGGEAPAVEDALHPTEHLPGITLRIGPAMPDEHQGTAEQDQGEHRRQHASGGQETSSG
jgi:hypothetical protein